MMVVYMVLLVAIFGAKTRAHPTGDEPSCTSYFDYNSKMLSKMLSVEFNFQKAEEEFDRQMKLSGEKLSSFQTEIGEQKQYIEDKLAESERKCKQDMLDLSELQDQQLRDKFLELEQRTTQAIEALSSRVSLKLQELEGAKTALATVMETADQSTVAFSANMHTDQSIQSGQKLSFNTVTLDTDDAFDRESGVFTAPVSGTYMFAVHLYIGQNKVVAAKVVAGGETVARVRGGSSVTHPVFSGFGVAVLQKGDRAWTELVYRRPSTGSILYDDSMGETSFKGVLIHT